VTPLERNRVGIPDRCHRGPWWRSIKQINIVGNQVFDDKTLLHAVRTQYADHLLVLLHQKRPVLQARSWPATWRPCAPGTWTVAISTSTSSPRRYPFRRTRKTSTLPSISPKARSTASSEARLSGDLPVVEPEELFPHVSRSMPGDVFSRKLITESVTKLGPTGSVMIGYAFANVNTMPEVDEENHEVTVTFFVDPGKRVYMRRINMLGNVKTRDEVLRQEMRQMEGGWFSSRQGGTLAHPPAAPRLFRGSECRDPAGAGQYRPGRRELHVTEQPLGQCHRGCRLFPDLGPVAQCRGHPG
jgi:outer membrane protein insertion porin family